MKIVRLGAIAETLPCAYGKDPIDQTAAFEVVKVSNISDRGQFQGEFERRRFRDDQLANLLVKQGELLVVKSSGSKANVLSGKTAICGADRAGRIVASNFLLRLRVDESSVVPRYVWYVLNSGASKAFVRTIVGASTYPNLKWSLYASHPIPLPPLAEQRGIAEVLDRADALRAKRRAALAQLDTLTQTLFVEEFGDPLNNTKHVKTSNLASLCVRITDGTHQPPKWSKEGHPFLFVSNIITGDIDFHTEKFISDETHGELMRRCAVEVGDVLYSTVGSYGVPALVRSERKFAFQRHIAHLKPDQSLLDSEFLWAMLASPAIKRQADRAARGIAQKTVNLSEIRDFLVFQPPLEVQREFARRIAAVEKLKSAHRTSLAELDALFASLQHRAFRGEL
jgi:type I restriction enzyme S subunit